MAGRKAQASTESVTRIEQVERLILLIHGERVLLDADLAAMYGVETKVLVRAVKRNHERFPSDFMFQLSDGEFENLRFHFGTSSSWGGRRYPPYAFTEHGVPQNVCASACIVSWLTHKSRSPSESGAAYRPDAPT